MGEIRLPSRSVAGAPRSRGRSAATIDAGDIAQVPLAKDPGLKIPEGAFGGGIGEAVGGFGDALADFGKAVQRAGERQQKQFDATKTAESELGFDQVTMAELGRWAKDQPQDPQSLGTLKTWLGTQEAEHLANLDKNVSEGARTAHAFRLRAKSQTIADVADQVSLKAATDGALKVIAAQTDQLAAQARTDPGLVRIFLGEGEERLQAFANTMTPQAESQARTQLRASVTRAAIGGLVQQDSYDQADALAESAKYNADLDPAALARATAEIQTGRRMATAEVQQRSADHFASIASTGQGVRGLANKAASVLDTAGKADFTARESGAGAAYGDLQIVAFASPDQVDAAVERLKPAPGAPIEAQYRYTLFRDAAAQMLRERIVNPAASAMKHPGVAEAYAAAAKDPTLLPAAIAKSLAVQEAIGIPAESRRILPDPYGAAARIAAMPAAQAPGAIDTLRQQYGKHWGQARGELVGAGLPAPYVVLGALDAPQMAVARAELAGALTTGRATLVKSIDPQQQADIAGALDYVRWDEIETTYGASHAAMRIAAELVAYRYAAEGRPNPVQQALRTLDFAPTQATADPLDDTAPDGSDEVTAPDGTTGATPGEPDPNAAPTPITQPVPAGSESAGVRLQGVPIPAIGSQRDEPSVYGPARWSASRKMRQTVRDFAGVNERESEHEPLPDPVPVPGLIWKPNIGRSIPVLNPDKTITAVPPISLLVDGQHVLIPKVSDTGGLFTDEEAIALYRRTGKHLGVFDTPENAKSYGQRVADEMRRHYGVPVRLPDGSTIPNPRSDTGVLMSPNADLSDVAAAGRKLRIENDPTRVIEDFVDFAVGLGLNLGHGGTFDYQRGKGSVITGFEQLFKFRDVANVNVGLFCQQAGLSLTDTLRITGAFAALRGSNAKMDQGGIVKFLNSAIKNQENFVDPENREMIEKGWYIGESGIYGEAVKRSSYP